MSKAIFFHLRKQIKTSMPNEFGAGKSLQPSDDFNHDGRMTYAFGDYDGLIARLKVAIGQAYVIIDIRTQRSITIKRITDIN